MVYFFFFKQKTAYEMRISDWSSDVCSSDLRVALPFPCLARDAQHRGLARTGIADDRRQPRVAGDVIKGVALLARQNKATLLGLGHSRVTMPIGDAMPAPACQLVARALKPVLHRDHVA